MDMEPARPKAVWGFNGTERPGAVYLAAVLAGHTQKGLPAFGIYGRDVQDAGDTTIPEDVVAKILRFTKAGLAVAMMKGKSYLSMGGCSMGIAGSIVDQDFFEEYLGMRVEAIDLTEVSRRLRDGIYDQAEYEEAYDTALVRATETTAPTLVLMGEHDIMTRPKGAEILADAIPNATFVIVPDAGHMVMVERPDPVIDTLLTFWSGT